MPKLFSFIWAHVYTRVQQTASVWMKMQFSVEMYAPHPENYLLAEPQVS